MGSRLLQLNQQRLTHGSFNDLTKQLRAGDLLVLNDTRVVKARLQAVKDSGGTAEILLERVLLPSKGHVSASSAEAYMPGAGEQAAQGRSLFDRSG